MRKERKGMRKWLQELLHRRAREPTDGKQMPTETADERRRRLRREKELENFWRYTGDEQAEIQI